MHTAEGLSTASACVLLTASRLLENKTKTAPSLKLWLTFDALQQSVRHSKDCRTLLLSKKNRQSASESRFKEYEVNLKAKERFWTGKIWQKQHKGSFK